MNKTGFGYLRLPRINPSDETSVDYSILNAMVDRFLELGGTYFDTAYTYLNGASEEAIRKSLTERHPRNRFVLADKLPGYNVKSYEECMVYFEEQLKRCGVDYFDVFLLHWLNKKNYAIAEQHDEFRFLQELKNSGKAKKIGFSYHDGPELLDTILTAHPEVDIVQLQLNYLDWDSESLQASRLYEVAVKHNKQIVVMEPVKGGSLASLPEAASSLLKNIHPEESCASWAIRFASGLEHVAVVLSGMNTMEQMEDNMRDMAPLTGHEQEILRQAAEIIRNATAVPCTGCSYCTSHCPKQIPIPRYFSMYNDYKREPGEMWKMKPVYHEIAGMSNPASSCIECKACERHCPQKLTITDYLKEVKNSFEA